MTIKKISFLANILFLIVFLAACSSPEEKKERHYLKAMEYLKQEDFNSAVIELKNAIQLDAKFAEARYQLGKIYLKESDPRSAFEQFIRVADLDHENLDASVKAAELYLIARNIEESRKLIERVLAIDPMYVDGLALLANIELIEGNFDAALGALEKIDDKVKTSDRLLSIKGRIFAAKNNYAAAEEAFINAIKVGGDRLDNYKTLLLFYKSRNQMSKAKSLLRETATTFPDNPQSHLLVADLHRSEGDFDAAEKSLLKVIELSPDMPQYRLILVDYYLDNDKIDKAKAALKKAQEDLGDNADISAELAKLYFEQKDFDKARNLVKQIQETSPGHGRTKLLHARFLLKDKRVREAIDVLENVTNDFPKWAEPFFYLGLARFAVGQVELAQYAVSTAIENNRNESKYHTLLAQLFLIEGDFSSAKREAAVGIKLKPQNFRAALLFTQAMIGAKEYDAALKILNEMHEKMPGDLEVLSNLAVAALRSGDEDNGRKFLEKIIAIHPGNTKAVTLFMGLKYGNDLQGAEVFLRRQIAKAPESSGLHYLLGELLNRQGMQEKSLAAYEKAIELNPDNIGAYSAAGSLLVLLNKKEEAIKRYEAMIAHNPKWLQGYMGLATVYESENNVEKAIEMYRRALEIQPDFAPAANNLAWHMASSAQGDMGEALRLAMIAKRSFPDDPHIADTLGWIHYTRGAYTLAIPQFEIALNTKPDNPTIQYHYALALKSDGQKEKATGILQSLLKSDVHFKKRDEAEALLNEIQQ